MRACAPSNSDKLQASKMSERGLQRTALDASLHVPSVHFVSSGRSICMRRA